MRAENHQHILDHISHQDLGVTCPPTALPTPGAGKGAETPPQELQGVKLLGRKGEADGGVSTQAAHLGNVKCSRNVFQGL